jgi:hypothetical protein
MPRRIDIELTSALADGSWTWRKAGARVPKGVLDGGLLAPGAAVGDQLKVEVEQELDGIEVKSVIQGREKTGMQLLELLPVEVDFAAVIETRAKRDRNDRQGGDARRGKRDDRGGRDGRKRGDGDSRRDGRDGRDRDGAGDNRNETRRGPRRPHFDPPPEVPLRPKAKRLRPGKARRNEVLASIPEEQRPIAELAIQGMAAVRTRLAEDNKKLAAEGKPTMPQDSVLKMAEELMPKLRVADWLDRAEAAERQMEHLDLRDLRSVVVGGDDPMVARDESTRALAEKLKTDLAKKQEEELKLWLEDIDASLTVGRSIRALRLSSQPPKAGVMFPPDLARRLGEAATAGLTPDDSSDRWAAVMEAAAFAPVRTLVAPTAPPTVITDELRATALRLGPLLPQIAALLGVEVPAGAPRPKPLRPGPRTDNKGKRTGQPSDGRSDRESGRRDDRKERSPRGPKPNSKQAEAASVPSGDAGNSSASIETSDTGDSVERETSSVPSSQPDEPTTEVTESVAVEPASVVGVSGAVAPGIDVPESAEPSEPVEISEPIVEPVAAEPETLEPEPVVEPVMVEPEAAEPEPAESEPGAVELEPEPSGVPSDATPPIDADAVNTPNSETSDASEGSSIDAGEAAPDVEV